MPKRLNKSYPTLREFLSANDLDGFSVLELRDLYVDEWGTGEFANKSALRKWLYRHLCYLEEKGLLVRSNQENEKPARYKRAGQLLVTFDTEGETSQRDSGSSPTKPASSVEKLKARQGQYQVDMLACQGECKEYEQIAQEFPELTERVRPMYRRARERSSKLFGQLRAISNLLQHSEHQ